MSSRYYLFLLVLLVSTLLSGSFWADEHKDMQPLTAMVLSDLHFTGNTGASHTVVAGMAYSEEIIDAAFAQAVGEKPDVLILTGDNTNSGSPADAAVLAEKLEQMKKAGISVIITTGNHDFDQSNSQAFESAYFTLPDIADRDPASLSYTVVFPQAVFLAMDDSSYAAEYQTGIRFSDETMQWLEAMLQKYRNRPVIFLSHHNVLMGRESSDSASYRIQNDQLIPLLSEYGVRLCLTGHLHSLSSQQYGSLNEIVSAMPCTSPYLYGHLEIDSETICWQANHLDLESWGREGLAEALSESEEENARIRTGNLDALLEGDGYDARTREGILSLMQRFLLYYAEGDLADHIDEIREDAYCERMIEALWDYNYGPWMQSVLEQAPPSASHLMIRLDK